MKRERDLVVIEDGVEAVCNRQDGTALALVPQRLLDHLFAAFHNPCITITATRPLHDRYTTVTRSKVRWYTSSVAMSMAAVASSSTCDAAALVHGCRVRGAGRRVERGVV